MQRIIVIGAGITGLATAWYLKKRFGGEAQVTVLEQSHRAGGWIQTSFREGFLFEQGPRSCRPKGKGFYTLKLIEELGLQDEVIPGSPQAHRRYLYRGGQLRQMGLFSLLFSPGVLKACLNDWRAPKGDGHDESIYEFASRRFSPAIAEEYFDPLCSGIYAGDIRKLSLKSCFPFLHQWEQEHGSVIKGSLAHRPQKLDGVSDFIKKMQQSALFSFKKGMQTLTDALAAQLDIEYNASIKRICFDLPTVSVKTLDGKKWECDYLISALPGRKLAPLLPFPEVSALLESIPSVSLAVVNLGYRRQLLKKQGFGYLIPSKEKQNNLGVVWDSCIFPEQNRPDETRLTVMIGGEMKDEEILRVALDSVSKQMNIKHLPDSYEIKLAKYAIPQYLLNHTENILKIEGELASRKLPFSLLGSSLYGVAINDCIAKAYHFVQATSLQKNENPIKIE